MPIWIAVLLALYALHLLWQAWRVLPKLGRESAKIVFFFWIPLFAAKVFLVAVGSSFWSIQYCATATRLSLWLIFIPALLSALEASVMRHIIWEQLHVLRSGRWYYPSLVVQIFVTLIIPAMLLILVFKIIALNQCAP
jgi:hypothetical protein